MLAKTEAIWRLGASRAVWLVLGLTFVFTAMRAVGLFGPASLRWLLPLSFVLMMVVPWVTLTRTGRARIGLAPSSQLGHYGLAILLGALGAAVCFGLGYLAFGTSRDNWFMSVASNYRQSFNTVGLTLLQLYVVFTLPALLFSPLGEEIFFRGFLQHGLEEHFSSQTSTVIACAVFGLIHLLHHGLILSATGFILRPLSAVIWVGLMALIALLFVWLRRRSGSLFPGVASHASFNLTMNLFIFLVLWESA